MLLKKWTRNFLIEMRTEGRRPKGLEPNEKDRAECKTARMALSPLILLRSLDHLLARHSTNKFALCSCFVRRFSFNPALLSFPTYSLTLIKLRKSHLGNSSKLDCTRFGVGSPISSFSFIRVLCQESTPSSCSC